MDLSEWASISPTEGWDLCRMDKIYSVDHLPTIHELRSFSELLQKAHPKYEVVSTHVAGYTHDFREPFIVTITLRKETEK